MATERSKHAQRYKSELRSVAANIRRLRTKLGWTQEQLAEAADLEPRYAQTLESGAANPSAAVLLGVADALGVNVGALFRPAKLPPLKRGRPAKPGSSTSPAQHGSRRRAKT